MNFKPKELKDQVIVVTGATSGIGLATAKLAAKEGAQVVLNARNLKELKKCVQAIIQDGGQAVAAPGDISDYESITKIRDKALEAYGRIDTWVNNAGVAIYGELVDTNFDEEKRLFDVNFWGTRMASQVAVEELRKSGGTLINVGSELSEFAPSVLGIYAASKHAIKAFTDALRIELQIKKVPVNVCLIRPTSIATPMPEHGANRLEKGEPSLPSMLYHPNLVATMIIRCAVNPQRDVFVGAQARLSSISSTIFPAFSDAVARLRSSAISQGMPDPHRAEDENLQQVPRSEGKVLGNFQRVILRNSLYSDLATLGFRGTIKSYLTKEQQ